MRFTLYPLRLLAGALLALGLASAAHAQARVVVLPYDGALDLDGAPADGLFDMRFALYAAPTGGEPLWTEAWTAADARAVRLTQGRFHVALGRFNPIDATLRHGGDLFLGIGIKAPAAAEYLTLAGRQRLDPVGHALYSLAGERLAVPELSVGGTAAVAGAIELAEGLTVTGTFTHAATLRLDDGLNAGDATVGNVRSAQQVNSDQVTAGLLRLNRLTVTGTLDAARLAPDDDEISFPQGVSTPAGAALLTRALENGNPVLEINGGGGLNTVGFDGPVQIGTAQAPTTWRHHGHLDTASLSVTASNPALPAVNANQLNVGEGTIHGWTSFIAGGVTASACRVCLNVRGQVSRHSCVTLDGAQSGGYMGLPSDLDGRSTFSLSYVCDGGASGSGNGVVE